MIAKEVIEVIINCLLLQNPSQKGDECLTFYRVPLNLLLPEVSWYLRSWRNFDHRSDTKVGIACWPVTEQENPSIPVHYMERKVCDIPLGVIKSKFPSVP